MAPHCRRLLLAVILATAGSISTVPGQAARRSLVLRDSTYRLVSDFGPDTLLVRELHFVLPVIAAQVDSSSGTLVATIAVHYWPEEATDDARTLFRKEMRETRVLTYDLRERKVAWEDSRRALPAVAVQRRALLQHAGKHVELIRLPDGRKLMDVLGDPYLWGDGVALRVTGGAIYRWNLFNLDDVWRAERAVRGPIDGVIRRDSVFYVIAEGIEKFDLDGRSLWSLSVPTHRSGVATLPGGYGTIQTSGGARAINLSALPLIRDPDIFFAADTTVIRLDSRTGKVRWRRHLQRGRGFSLRQRALGLPITQEFLGHLVVRDAIDNIVVASLGWASAAGNKWTPADPPSLALLSKQDGRLVARVQVPGVQFLADTWSTRFGHYVLARDRLLAMDDRLNLRATYRAPQELQPLGRVLTVGERVVVSTASGIAAFSPDSLKLLWSHPSGRLLDAEYDWDWAGGRYIVTTQGLLRLDHDALDRPGAYYPLRGTWAKLSETGAIIGSGATLRLVTLPAPKPAERSD